jgi:hypothetical protein
MAIISNGTPPKISIRTAATATYALGSFEVELDGNGLQNMVNFLNAQALLGFLPESSSETGEQGFVISRRGHEVWLTIQLVGGAQLSLSPPQSGAFHARRFEIQHDATGLAQFVTFLNTLLRGTAGLYHTFCYTTDAGVYLIPLVGADLTSISPPNADQFQQFATFDCQQFEIGENGLGIGQLADYLQLKQTGGSPPTHSYLVEYRSYEWNNLSYIVAIVSND